MKNDDELLDIARAAVPDHLKPLGRIIRPEPPADAPAVTASGPHARADDALVEALAQEVGATLSPRTDDSADVEFVEHTRLGSRSTVVQIRDGKVARVLKRA